MGRRFLKTLLFLTPVYVPIILIGVLFGLIGAIIGLLISFIICMLIILNVDTIILRMYKAHPSTHISKIREKALILSNRAGVPMPSICITELPLPGSLIVGKSPYLTTLVVPTRLLNLLNDEELEASLAYNIVQINNTIRLRTLVALIAGLFTMAASGIRWGAVFTGFGDYNDPAPRLFGLFIMGLVAPPAAIMIHSVTEQDYDAEAVSLCKNPDAFISAIERLENNNNVAAYPSLGFLCLIDPQKEIFFEYFFNTHPSKERRIKNLIERGGKHDRITSRP
jgi:heat shock protein HtpX